MRNTLLFVSLSLLLILLFFISACMGSLSISPLTLFRGLFVEYNDTVSVIYDLRLPRMIISVFAGAALAISGVLTQAAMKNPIADPGMIGISSGAAFSTVLITAFAPSLFFLTPLFALAGGILAFLIVYGLSWNGGLNPLRVVLVGVAVNAMFVGISSAFNSFGGGNLSGVAAIVNGNITMKTWDDTVTLFGYTAVGLILAFLLAGRCDLLALEDKTARSLGVNVDSARLAISFTAVLLASGATAIVGVIGFLGLIAPHIARILVGTAHRRLLPFSGLLGAFILLLADTLGRTVALPYEIPAAVLMAVVGGPFFIFLLRKSGREYGK